MTCSGCGQRVESFLDRHLCPSCGRIQPLSETREKRDYFDAFGVERRFGVDRGELEKRFYQISRALHPDRFTGAEQEQRRLSLERMSFVNEAYQTLKSPAKLRSYLIELEGAKLPEKSQGQVPMELAESWFELQDALTENPDEAKAKLSAFESELRRMKAESADQAVALEREIDSGVEGDARKKSLDRLARMEQQRNYLDSMERDVERIRGRLKG